MTLHADKPQSAITRQATTVGLRGDDERRVPEGSNITITPIIHEWRLGASLYRADAKEYEQLVKLAPGSARNVYGHARLQTMMLLAQLTTPEPPPPLHWINSHEVAPVQSSKQLEPPLHLTSQVAAPLQSTSQVAPNLHSAVQVVAPTQSKPQLHAELSQTGEQLFPDPHASTQVPDEHPLHAPASGSLGLASGGGVASGRLGSASGELGFASGRSTAANTQRPITHVRGASQSAWVSQLNTPDRESTELQPTAHAMPKSTATERIIVVCFVSTARKGSFTGNG
jgi:hypothetical protein